MLIAAFLKGVAVGIVLALPLGPMGMLCVRRTMFESMIFGLVSGLGAAVADTLFGAVAGFGLTVVRDWVLGYEDWLGAAGGVLLAAIGIRALTVRAPVAEPLRGEALVGTFISAFAITLGNPITILALAAIFAKLGLDRDAPAAAIGLLVAGVFVGSALWWLGLTAGIAALVRRERRLSLAALSRASGAVLAACGVGLLVAATLGLAGIRL